MTDRYKHRPSSGIGSTAGPQAAFCPCSCRPHRLDWKGNIAIPPAWDSAQLPAAGRTFGKCHPSKQRKNDEPIEYRVNCTSPFFLKIASSIVYNAANPGGKHRNLHEKKTDRYKFRPSSHSMNFIWDCLGFLNQPLFLSARSVVRRSSSRRKGRLLLT